MENTDNDLVLEIKYIISKYKESDFFNSDIEKISTDGIPSILLLLKYCQDIDLLNQEEISENITYFIHLMITTFNRLEYMDSSWYSGLSSFLCTLIIFEEQQYQPIIISLSKIYLKVLKLKIEKVCDKKRLKKVTVNDYDFIDGLSGSCICLSFLHGIGVDVRECIIAISSYFSELIDDYKTYFTELNLGFSHGLAGILGALTICYYIDDKNIKLQQAIRKIQSLYIDTLSETEFQDKKYAGWPKRIDILGYKNKNWEYLKGRESWCYGSPGIVLQLMISINVISSVEMYNLITKQVMQLKSMGYIELLFDNYAICHGYSGYFLIMNQLGFSCTIPNYFENDTTEVNNYQDLGLLSGKVGVVLTELDKRYNIENDWKRLFMISYPVISNKVV